MTFSFALRVAIATMLTAATPLVFAQTKRAHNLENNQSIISNELWSTVSKAGYIRGLYTGVLYMGVLHSIKGDTRSVDYTSNGGLLESSCMP